MFIRQWLFALIISCIGLGVSESACDDYNRYPYNSTSTSLCHGCVSDPCHICIFCTEGISKSAYCTSDLSQCPLDNQKQQQIDCPRQETIQSSPSSVRNKVNKQQKNETAHFDCPHNRVYLVLENEAAVDLGINKQMLLSDELRQGENPVPFKLFSNLCGSVQNSKCPLSSSPILAVGKDCIEIGEKESDEVYLNNATEGLSGGFRLNFGQVRCCSSSQAREVNLTLKFLCNSNSPDLELSENSLDVLSEIGDCDGMKNLTIVLLTEKLCPENIRPVTSGLANRVIAVSITVLCLGVLLVVSTIRIWLKLRKKSNNSGETERLVPNSTKTRSKPPKISVVEQEDIKEINKINEIEMDEEVPVETRKDVDEEHAEIKKIKEIEMEEEVPPETRKATKPEQLYSKPPSTNKRTSDGEFEPRDEFECERPGPGSTWYDDD